MTARTDITALVVDYFAALDARDALTGREDMRTIAEVREALHRAGDMLRNAAGVRPADPLAHARIEDALRNVGRHHLPAVDWEQQVWARVQAPRASWVRRAWRRLTGGRP